MGEAFLMRRGGGSGGVAVGDTALICVKLPAGSTCTCTKGTTVFSASNAPGLAAFSVPEAGTWTLAITDGEQTAGDTVTVAAGDVKIVTLAYTPAELVILSPENGLANGYSGAGGAAVDGNTVKMTNQGYITPAIDLTNYSTLTVTGVTTHMDAQGYDGKVFVDADAPNHYTDYSYNFAKTHVFEWTDGVTDETYAFDVSDLTGAYYIGQCTSGSTFVFKSIVLS